MLDIQFIRDNTDEVKRSAQTRNVSVDIDELLRLDEERRQLHQQVEDLRHRRNELSKSAKQGKPAPEDIAASKEIKEQLSNLEPKLDEVEDSYNQLLLQVPNVTGPDVPVGEDDSGNQVLYQWGDIPRFDFKPIDHVELGEALEVIDNERAAKVSGARFTYLKGDLALMQFALTQFVLQVVTDERILGSIIEAAGLELPATPFTPVIPPALVRPETMQRMARLEPKEDRFITLDEEYVLVGSAEHSLGPMFMDEVLEAEQLPFRLIGYSSSFRREAGSYGKDTRGILRLHQFDKLEMETFSTAEKGLDEHYFMVAIQEHIVRKLNLPYQKVAICTGDMGDPDYMQTDLEVWLPGQDRYRETHTADYMTDYQSRRLKTRYKDDGTTKFAYMNDATAVAIGRTLIAIMENYQTKEGTVMVPEVLRPYLGKDEIKPKDNKGGAK